MKAKWIIAGVLCVSFFLLDQQKIEAQGIIEYGKQLEGLKKRRPSGKRMRLPPVTRGGANPGGNSETIENSSITPVPSMLAVKGSEANLHVSQDAHSEVITRLERGEKLTTLGTAFGSGGVWYMVKTQKGTIGWVSSSNVADVSGNKK